MFAWFSVLKYKVFSRKFENSTPHLRLISTWIVNSASDYFPREHLLGHRPVRWLLWLLFSLLKEVVFATQRSGFCFCYSSYKMYKQCWKKWYKILKYFFALIFTDILVRGSEEDGGGFCKENRPQNQSSYLLAPCRSTDFWEPGILVGVVGGCPPFLSGSSAAVKTYYCCWHDSRSITFCRLDQCSFYSFYQFTCKRQSPMKKICWLLGVTGMTNQSR